MHTTPRFSGALLLLAIGCSAAPPAVEKGGAPAAPPGPAKAPFEEEWDHELPAGVQIQDLVSDEEGDGRAVVPVRVVADRTGAPIPGARIDNWEEADTPGAEPWEDLHEGSWTTDRDGWALLPALNNGNWYFVEAPGWGPHAEMSLDDEYRLVPGTDFTLEVRDWRDRPVPGAMVEAFLGCGHTPNVRTETAGSDGRLVFRCIDPSQATDLWVRTPGLAGRNPAYWGSGPEGLPVEGGIHVLRGDPAPVLEGQVLRNDGTPAAGARVGTREAHRGPWTIAGPDGKYRLVGVRPYDEVIAMAPYADPVPDGFLGPQVEFRSAPGVFAVVRLPAKGERRPAPEEAEAARDRERKERKDREARAAAGLEEPEPEVPAMGPGIRVRVEAAAGGPPLGWVRVLLVRDGDGATNEEFLRFRDGVAVRALSAGPGSWTVTAGDPAGMLRPVARRVEVKSGWSEAAFTLEPNPNWRPRVLERSADGKETVFTEVGAGTFRITTDDGVVDATPHPGGDGGPDGALYVPAMGPFTMEFEAKDARSARVLLDGPPAGPGPALVLPPPVPEEPWIDEYTCPRDFPGSRIAVLYPDGRPAAGAEVHAVSPEAPFGPNAHVRRSDQRDIYLDEGGAAECGFDRGERLLVLARGDGAEGLLPFEARIDGPGPWTLRWPAAEVAVRVVDEAGSPLRDYALSRGGSDTIAPADGVVRLRGVSAGPLRLWVAAPGRRIHDLRLVIVEGRSREVVVRMSPAASASAR